LSEYLLEEVTRVSRRPTLEEMKVRIAAHAQVEGRPPAAEMLESARREG
jgi:hypothetical protein